MRLLCIFVAMVLIVSCFVENFSLTPGFSRVRKVREGKNRLNGFFPGAFMVHRVKTRC
jgi:hypothetical protein